MSDTPDPQDSIRDLAMSWGHKVGPGEYMIGETLVVLPEADRPVKKARAPRRKRADPLMGQAEPPKLPPGPLTIQQVAAMERTRRWDIGTKYAEPKLVNCALEIVFYGNMRIPAGTPIILVGEVPRHGDCEKSYDCYAADGEHKGHHFSTTHTDIYGPHKGTPKGYFD